MALSFTAFGGPLNSKAYNVRPINAIVRADYKDIVGGHVSSLGSAPVYGYFYCHPTGNLVTSGFVTESYGQLAVIGGYSSFSTTPTDSCYGQVRLPVGHLVSSGSADAYGIFAVQHMHTTRTAVVVGSDFLEASILPYAVTEAVVQTENRLANVPALESYY